MLVNKCSGRSSADKPNNKRLKTKSWSQNWIDASIEDPIGLFTSTHPSWRLLQTIKLSMHPSQRPQFLGALHHGQICPLQPQILQFISNKSYYLMKSWFHDRPGGLRYLLPLTIVLLRYFLVEGLTSIYGWIHRNWTGALCKSTEDTLSIWTRSTDPSSINTTKEHTEEHGSSG